MLVAIMLQYPQWLKPTIFTMGPVSPHWYGAMYVIGFVVGRYIMRGLARKGYVRLTADAIDDLIIYLFVGMLLGARLVHLLIYYKPTAEDPFHWYTPFAVWQGGLSFHGAVIGIAASAILFARKYKVPFWNLGDTIALAGSPGIIFGRIGNFINAELYGRVTDGPMGMRFPLRDETGAIRDWTEPRHPSQLYEALGEGVITCIILWIAKPYIRNQGVMGGLWLSVYAVARFVIEFFREKDAQLSYYFGWMTMGQILCSVMLLIGIGIMIRNTLHGTPIPSASATPEAGAPA